MARSTIYFIGLTLVLGYTAFSRGGFPPWELNYSLLGVGLITVFYWSFPSRSPRRVPRLDRRVFWPLLLLTCYIVFQMVPLPIPLVKFLSPARSEQIEGLRVVVPRLRTATISLMPGATFSHFLRAAACIAIFLTVRDIVLRRPARAWAAAIPFIVVGTLEAILGLLQYWEGEGAQKMAQGTYPNHSHYADLLGMVLPFAIMYASVIARREKKSGLSPARSVLWGSLLVAASAAIFLAIVLSLSGSGFISSLASLALMGILRLSRSVRPGWRWASVVAVGLLTVAGLILIPPDPVVQRLEGEMRMGEGARPSLWGQAVQLVPVYPVFGAGLGGFESALYQRAGILHDKMIDYAHNDYLQLLVELGIAGFAIGAVLVAAVVRPAVATALREPKTERGALAIACAGSLAAFLIHCITNFNFYAPANAMTIASVSGLTQLTQLTIDDLRLTNEKDADAR